MYDAMSYIQSYHASLYDTLDRCSDILIALTTHPWVTVVQLVTLPLLPFLACSSSRNA